MEDTMYSMTSILSLPLTNLYSMITMPLFFPFAVIFNLPGKTTASFLPKHTNSARIPPISFYERENYPRNESKVKKKGTQNRGGYACMHSV